MSLQVSFLEDFAPKQTEPMDLLPASISPHSKAEVRLGILDNRDAIHSVFSHLSALDIANVALVSRGMSNLVGHYYGSNVRINKSIYLEKAVKRFPNMRTLNLMACKDLKDEHMKSIRLCQALSMLDISHTNISDDGIAQLKGMPLTHVAMDGCQTTAGGLRHFKDMPLEYLDIGGYKPWEGSENIKQTIASFMSLGPAKQARMRPMIASVNK